MSPLPHSQKAFWRICASMCLCGGTAFSALYFVQPLLPIFTRDFAIPSAQASLALAVPTVSLILGLFMIGPLSDRLGRKPVILGSAIATAILLGLMALTNDWITFLVLRGLVGLTLGGVTAINLTYLAEELPKQDFSKALGYVLAGNSIGGMLARLLMSACVESIGWRASTAILAAIGLFSAALVALWLPKSRNFTPKTRNPASSLGHYLTHLKNPALRIRFLQACVLMGSFVAFFNIVNFHLEKPEFGLTTAQAGLISLTLLPAAFTAVVTGRLSASISARRLFTIAVSLIVVGAGISLVPNVFVIGLGASLFAVGFFAAHTIAASQVGKNCASNRAHATALYQMAFYFGASSAGVLAGFLWQIGDWNLVIALIILSCITAAFLQTKEI